MERSTRSLVAAAACLVLAARPARAAGGIEILPDPLTLLILIAGFALLVYPVNAVIFRPLLRVLDEREGRIAGARERARRLGSEADAILSRYEGEVSAARERAAAERRARVELARREELAVTGAARAEAERELERARAEVGAALAEARDGLRAQAEELAREAARRILGRELR